MAEQPAVKNSSLIKRFMSENLANSAKSKVITMTTPSKEEHMDTKQIGNIGEAKVLCEFVELGIPVYVPFGDNERADLIADFNGKLNKIQVKTSIKAEDGKMIFDLTSSTVHRKNGIKHLYSSDEIDYYACYNITRDKIFLVPVDTPRTAIIIRYEKPKNNQVKGIHFEDEYLIINVLSCVETVHEIPQAGKDTVRTTM